MGRVRTEQPSERKRLSNQANARKPRGRWAGTTERAVLDEAKRLLREAIPAGAANLARLIRSPDTPPEILIQAFKLAADRVGLPVVTQAETALMNAPPVVVVVPEGCAWVGVKPEDAQVITDVVVEENGNGLALGDGDVSDARPRCEGSQS